MWSSTNDDDVANRLSVLSTMDVASIADSATPTECKDAIIQSLQNQLLQLESNNAALQRSVPRFAKLLDSTGKDVTEQMTELTRQLTDRDCQLENANALCARKHEELELVRTELLRRLRAAEEQAAEATRRAKAYETENGVLREQIENEQSRLYRIGHMGDHSGTGTDTDTLAGSHAAEQEILDKLQQELNDRLAEVEAYRSDIDELRHKYETQTAEFNEMKALNVKYRTFIDRVLAGDELKKSFLEKSLTAGGTAEDGGELDYAVANLLATLQLLDANGRVMAELRTEVMDSLRRHGYAANEAVVEVLSQSLRHDISQRRQSIVDEQVLDAAVENQLAQVSMSATLNISALNKTAAEVSQDIGAARRQMGALRAVCTQLFEKLRGTAEFLEQLLEMLGETEEGREILKRIQELRLDLDKSLHEANFAASEFEKAEKSMIEYCEMMSQLVDTSVFNFSVAADEDNDFAINMHEVDQLGADRDELKAELQQLEVERTNAKSELERVQSEAAEAAKKLDNLLAAVTEAAQEKERLKDELQQLEVERTDAKSQQERMQSEANRQLDELLAAKTEAAEDVKQFKAELQQLEAERTDTKSQLEREQSKVVEATNRLDELLANTAQAAEEAKQLEIERAAAAQQLDHVREELAETAQKLDGVAAEKTEVVQQLERVIAEKIEAVQQLERTIADRTAETKRLERFIAEKTDAIRSLDSEKNKENVPRPDTKDFGKQITGELSRIYDSLASAKATASSGGVFKPSNSSKK